MVLPFLCFLLEPIHKAMDACLPNALHDAGLLGTGQEAGTEEAFPIRELAHFLLQVHQGKPMPAMHLDSTAWPCKHTR